jgi:hypothetical protein
MLLRSWLLVFIVEFDRYGTYSLIPNAAGISRVTPRTSRSTLCSVLFAIPFIWMATVLTLRATPRRRLSLCGSSCFSCPFLNLIFFSILV